MEVELEPRVKRLPYKVKSMSRESPSQKAVHVLDTDLRTHWSTATNTKEWILLELEEPCLLSHIRIHNKSVLEWEIAVGLRYKPETFVKVRPRCEAPRRDIMYSMNYTPCRYVRISCLRGNPIALFFVQLIGVSVSGLEPEFLPVVNYLLPHIISHKQDSHDMHLQLLQNMTNRLLVFLPQLEVELNSFNDAVESNIRFLAMLTGIFYPLLHVVKERESMKSAGIIMDPDISKNCQSSSSLTVSSNFEPRRSRGSSSFVLSTYSAIVFRPDAIFVLLRKAYKDADLGCVCRMASQIIQKLIEPDMVQDASPHCSESTSVLEDTPRMESSNTFPFVDYSSLFGEEFLISDEHWDSSYLNILDIGAVEEGILHVLYASASQPYLCSKLAMGMSDLCSALPLIQALLPALRPSVSSPYHSVDESFLQWKQPVVQQALSQIVTTASSLYRPLLNACAGYLSSYSPSHARAASVLIDLCCGVLAPWTALVIAKVDLAIELLEDLLGTIQGARHSFGLARAAIKYIVLALSGHMDDILAKYKEVKPRILFLVEMLEPFLDPLVALPESNLAFGDLSSAFPEKQQSDCILALNVIRTAVQKPAVLPALESEWRNGSVAPSVLLSILKPDMQLPPEIDLCLSPSENPKEVEVSFILPSSVHHMGVAASKSTTLDETGKIDVEKMSKVDFLEDRNSLFAPPELQSMRWKTFSIDSNQNNSVCNQKNVTHEPKPVDEKSAPNLFPCNIKLDAGFIAEYLNLEAEYFQLVNYSECELRASEFQHLALNLREHNEISIESHNAVIDALLLAAECYMNPFFVLYSRASPKMMDGLKINGNRILNYHDILEQRRACEKRETDKDTVAHLERRRDKVVLEILLEAAELDRKYHTSVANKEDDSYFKEVSDEQVIKISSSHLQHADAITMIRQNQALLCNFLIQHLQREQTSMHEVLMQSLVFLLQSATKLYCAPEDVIDIILKAAEDLGRMLAILPHELKGGNLQLAPEKVHGIQRRWILVQKLVMASSLGKGEDFAIDIHRSFCCRNLIPPSAWMRRISAFSTSVSPLVRFIGWMAVSRNAKNYIKDRTFLVSDLSQLTCLLSIFGDELAIVDNIKYEEVEVESTKLSPHKSSIRKVGENYSQCRENESFRVLYPDLSKFFPNLKMRFENFGEIILEAVGLQLRSVSSTNVPDVLCWFSELCSQPFPVKCPSTLQACSDKLKGYTAKNARAIILYILEAIVVEHMEALVPEVPRVVQVLLSLSGAAYCDVSFLDNVLHLLKPIISYSLSRVSGEEQLCSDDSCQNFEELCFNALFKNIRHKNEKIDDSAEKVSNRALTIFILATFFPYISIPRKTEMLESLVIWADFYEFEPTTSFYDYLSAFQRIMESCKLLFVQALKILGVIPVLPSLSLDRTCHCESSLESHLWFLGDADSSSDQTEVFRKVAGDHFDLFDNQIISQLSSEDLEKFSQGVEGLITKLCLTTEYSWNLHPQMTKKLTIVLGECFVFLRCFASVSQSIHHLEDEEESSLPSKSDDQSTHPWRTALEGLADMILVLQGKGCWEVSIMMLDCLLGAPPYFQLDNVIGPICSAIKNVSCSAPKLTWRLQSDKWFSAFIARDVCHLQESEVPLIDLFCTLLGHSEPEQCLIALKHLGKLVGQYVNGGVTPLSFKTCCSLILPQKVSSGNDSVISRIVSSTWDEVVVLASSDASIPIRLHAMALLVDYIPYADRHQLQSFLAAADKFQGVGCKYPVACEGPFLQLSLVLISSTCMYSPAEDIALIPHNVWTNIETLGSSKHDGMLGDLEKRTCQVLCELKNGRDGATEALKEVLTSSSSKQNNPDFGSVRESILQVISNLTSVQSYFDTFSNKIDQYTMELEEAEMEFDILQKEQVLQEPQENFEDEIKAPFAACKSSRKDDVRLQQIKDQIRSIEKSRIREDIISRRQKKLIFRRARQKYLEEAALREAELLQDLDRERIAEVEKEIERQRLLELERAKTRELRHNLEMEKERQTQRELQRELEQAESGLRPSQRDFSSSSHSSRGRERFRERENGRSVNEGSTRTGMPTILQSCDRQDECGSLYEENFDGNKDSGDTSSIGDPDFVSTFDSQPSGYGSSQRHGSRGSKSRQVGERKERDSRREGKWERKHS